MQREEKEMMKELVKQMIADMLASHEMTNEEGVAPANVTPNIGTYDAKLASKVNRRKLKDYDLLDDEEDD